MRRFELVRNEDVSGISGTGAVAEGVEFSDGQVVMRWKNTGSLGIYKSVDQVLDVHGHDGRTEVVFNG